MVTKEIINAYRGLCAAVVLRTVQDLESSCAKVRRVAGEDIKWGGVNPYLEILGIPIDRINVYNSRRKGEKTKNAI